MLSINKKSYVMDYVMTPQIFDTPKYCAFEETIKKYSIDSTLWVRLSWELSHVRWSYVEVIVKIDNTKITESQKKY